MFPRGAVCLLSGIALSTCGTAASSGRATFGGAAFFRICGLWGQQPHPTTVGVGSSAVCASFSAQASGFPDPGSRPQANTHASLVTLDNKHHGDGNSQVVLPPPAFATDTVAGGTASTTTGLPPAPGPTSDGDAGSSGGAAAGPGANPLTPASRRDKSASADIVYPSSRDDNLGVQRNWFNALFTQLSVIQRTGMAPHLKGRQKEVFEGVEREFEGLWERHVRGKELEGVAHRGMIMCCLAIATHKVLLYETGDDTLVREVVRTNLGGTAVNIMMRLHKLRLWLLLRLLAEDPYKQAVRFLPTVHGDMGTLVLGQVASNSSESTWTASGCTFHSVLAAEGATELLPEFCCQFSMQWLEVFSRYGVRVGLEESLGFGDERCVVRITPANGSGSGT